MDDGMSRRTDIGDDLFWSYGCAYESHPSVRCGNAVCCFAMDRQLYSVRSNADEMSVMRDMWMDHMARINAWR
jgi:hypothetical protein